MVHRFHYRLLLLCTLLFSLCSLSEVIGEVYENPVTLSGITRFSFGDNAIWSSPAYDDSSWDISRSVKPWPEAKGWYRIHFSLPASSGWTDPGILLGQISGAEEIFLNGIKIGGEGTNDGSYVSAAKVERVCRIPRKLLHTNGDNLLAVRVISLHPSREEFPGRMRIGDFPTLLAEKNLSESRQIMLEVAVVVILLMNFLIFVLNIISGTLPKKMICFGAFIFIYLIIYTLNSLLFYGTGWKTPFVQKIYFTCVGLLPTTFIFLYQKKVAFYTKVAALVIIPAALGLPFFSGVQTYPLLPYVWCILVAVFGIWVVNRAWQNYINKVPEAGLIFIGTLCMLCAGILLSVQAIFPWRPFRFYEELLWILGGPVFMYLWIFALIRLFAGFRESQKGLSRKILFAQEQERERLSGELHDGIGQSLMAVKLNLDMMETKADRGETIKGSTITELKTEVAKIINDIRNIATTLRPSLFDKLNLAEAISDDGKRLERTYGIKIAINTVNVGDLPLQAKHNAYRIFQESMMNILKHADATEVLVNIAVQDKTLVIEITDNGRGFNAAQINASSGGLGLSTMRERAKLLGGALTIKTGPGSGTSILAKVPLP